MKKSSQTFSKNKIKRDHLEKVSGGRKPHPIDDLIGRTKQKPDDGFGAAIPAPHNKG